MKKMLILAAAAALCACGNQKRYTIEGSAEELAGTVYLYDMERNLLDSAVVENGAFRFEGTVETPTLGIVSDSRDDAPASFVRMFFLEPGAIVISADSDQRVSGTPANDASYAYRQAGQALIQEYRAEETSDERREAIEKEYDELTRTTMEANRGNYFGAQLLAQQMSYELSGRELLDEIAKFPAELQATDLLTKLKESAGQKMRTDIGEPYIDIEQRNAAGETVSLKSVIDNPANKYTLVDFWASWCGPCMGEVPYLKQTYGDFHDKGFEIYGVSFDKDREKWLGAVEQNGMNWVHVSDLNGCDNQAAKDYAVQGIPSNFLIDAEGKIVATNLRGEALREKIAELLAE